MDDLARRVDLGFTRVDEDLRALRSDMNIRFDAQDSRIDGLQRTMGGGLIATFLVGFISLVATQL